MLAVLFILSDFVLFTLTTETTHEVRLTRTHAILPADQQVLFGKLPPLAALKKWDTVVHGLPCLICLVLPLKLLKCETLVEYQTRVFRQVY
jgi:hypothetical protein